MPALQAIQRYLEELGFAIDPRDLRVKEEQRPSALCYLQDDGKLLMLRREKEPFAQRWTAPGGKIERGETPRDAIEREMREETGLSVDELTLKAICSESGDDPLYNWLLFIFEGKGRRGQLTPSDEGELRWIPLDQLDQHPLPDVDRRLVDYALDSVSEPYYIQVEYDADYSVKRFSARPLSAMAP